MTKNKITEQQAVGTSLAVSVSDVLLNLLVGLFTGSVVVISQSLQGLSDLVTAAILFRGVKASNKKADKRYPLGRGREVFFYVLVAGLFMFVGTGMASLLMGLNKIYNPSDIHSVWVALITLSFGFFSNGYSFNISRKRLGLNNFRRNKLQKVLNSSMLETKATLIVDMMGTLSASLGLLSLLLLIFTGNNVFDGIGAMLIGSLMMIASLLLVLDAKSLIVGRAVSPQINNKIIKAALTVEGTQSILDIKTMFLGSGRLLVILEVHFRDELSTDQIEQKSDLIKESVKNSLPQVKIVQVEAETPA